MQFLFKCRQCIFIIIIIIIFQLFKLRYFSKNISLNLNKSEIKLCHPVLDILYCVLPTTRVDNIYNLIFYGFRMKKPLSDNL